MAQTKNTCNRLFYRRLAHGGTDEDFALGPLLATFRAELGQIPTPRVVFEIDLLFNAKPSPEVRHALAHGQIGAGGCFSDVVYYAEECGTPLDQPTVQETDRIRGGELPTYRGLPASSAI
jgi:hypothetical protein